MTQYNWKIHYSEHYADEFKQMGNIDKEKAIEEFQLFPWDKEIDDYKRSNNNPSVPKIIFEADDKRQLIISSTSNAGYQLKYSNLNTNMFSDFYLSSNYEKKNYAPEEIIEFFFDNNLEKYIKLKSIPMPTEKKPAPKKSENKVVFNFKPTLTALWSFNFFVWLLVSVGYAILSAEVSDFPRWGLLLFLFTWPIPVLVHLSYYLKNKGAKVIIDTRNHDLTYIKGSKEIKFNRDDIFRCQITYSRSSNMSMCDAYSYVWFILDDRTYIVITHFIANPYKIVENLNCKFEEKGSGAFLPIL